MSDDDDVTLGRVSIAPGAVIGPVSVEQIFNTLPGQPVFAVSVSPGSGVNATCPVCGFKFEVSPHMDCFWPACGHWPHAADPLPDGSYPWCCESCGLSHALQCGAMP